VDELKIDRSFVSHMTSDERDAVIVCSTVELGRNLGLHVIAEGVEDSATWVELDAVGCHAIQGYYGADLPPATAGCRRSGMEQRSGQQRHARASPGPGARSAPVRPSYEASDFGPCPATLDTRAPDGRQLIEGSRGRDRRWKPRGGPALRAAETSQSVCGLADALHRRLRKIGFEPNR
jgi:hypothetical protein